MKRKPLPPKPEELQEGYMPNPVDIQGLPGVPSVGMPIHESTINWLAEESMKNWDTDRRQGDDYGMPHWRNDPSYNWRRNGSRSRKRT